MSVLVTGGAGYIGSHVALALLERGEKVVIIDNLSTGIRELVPSAAVFVGGDIGDSLLVRNTLVRHNVRAILHFAGSSVVPESVEQPLRYYANNTMASRTLIETALETGIRHFIFSSTAAVYRSPETATVDETAPTQPASPYGRSKLVIEWILEDTARCSSLHYVALRYFNVAGADPGGRSGQSTPHATHLIKRACQVALGQIPYLGIFGTDYPTPDGTGVRDYIHVSDLAAAHIHALDHLRAQGESGIFNCGYGHGFSVREIVAAVERATGQAIPVREMPRRAGDLPAVVSNPGKLKSRFGWVPRLDRIDTIVQSAFAWEKRLTILGDSLPRRPVPHREISMPLMMVDRANYPPPLRAPDTPP
ncbi:MAG TPA: UDP-glucose 4-epimerase GalE [Rhizomicrobium sp.]|jgi:UDP-glucose 4-epimerase